LRRGLGATLKAAGLAAVIALTAGALVAVARTSERRWVRVPAAVLIELFRGLPVVLLMFFSALALDLSIFNAVVLGLVLYNTAVIAEILRAGIQSLPRGQREAALAIGLTPGQTMRMILLPQAVRRMLPSLVSQLVVLLKDTSLGYIVGYVELLRVNRELRDFFGSEYIFSLFLVTAALYIGVNFALSRVATYLERRGSSRAAGGVAPLQPAEGVARDSGPV
jgi:glutamate transport system permease protein